MKKFLHKLFIFTFLVLFITVGCVPERVPEAPLPKPVITPDNPSLTYTSKVGKSITITPTYQYAEGATFKWEMEGKVLSTSASLTFNSATAGDFYVTLTVTNRSGSTSIEIKITVAEKLVPYIYMESLPGGYNLLKDEEFEFAPIVENEQGCSYIWSVDGAQAATTKNFKYKPATIGKHTVTLKVTNEDGAAQLSLSVNVYQASDIPFSWSFERDVYNYSTGRSIRIPIREIKNGFDAEYIWSLDGVEVQRGAQTYYVCSEAAEGAHTLVVKMQNSYRTATKKITINVCPKEGSYIRGGGTALWNKVYEYLPAPGQFINEGYTATTMEQACAYAQKRLEEKGYLSLGGWGGYIVVGFDHSILNDGGYNLAITGNAFKNSSEPGIVWVMQDENGNGLPDDTWYELKGSDYEAETKDFYIRYTKPKGAGKAVVWSASDGTTGTIDYLGAYHKQDYYYPAWVSTTTYTLYGQLLKSKTSELAPNSWINGDFGWGYADNFSLIDRLSDDSNSNADPADNHFKLSDAVTWDGKPANLKYIDFVKVQTAVNSKAGWIGELSTEVFGFKDYNMLK